jgi:hypothetical protein
LIVWDFKKGKLHTVGMTLFVDAVKLEKKKYVLFKDGVKIGELERTEHYMRL